MPGYGLYNANAGPAIGFAAANYAPVDSPQPGAPSNDIYNTPASVAGRFDVGNSLATQAQTKDEKYSITRSPLYQQGAGLFANAQNVAAAGQQTFNNTDQQFQSALAAQQMQAGGSAAQQSALAAQQANAAQLQRAALGNSASLGMLRAAAAGQGPDVSTIASQQGVASSLQAQLAAAANARGGASAQQAAAIGAAPAAQAAQLSAIGSGSQAAAAQQAAAQSQFANLQGQAQGQYAQAASGLSQAALQARALRLQGATGVTSAAGSDQAAQQNEAINLGNLYQSQGNTLMGLAGNQVSNDYGLAAQQMQAQTQQNIADQQHSAAVWGDVATGGGIGLGVLASFLSVGAAAAGARGARDEGLGPETAAKIGSVIGQRVGSQRLGGAPVPPFAARADAAAASRAAHASGPSQAPLHRPMSIDEARAHLADLRARALALAPRARGGR